jgi:hypothetical protein
LRSGPWLGQRKRPTKQVTIRSHQVGSGREVATLADVVFPPAARQYAEALVHDTDALVEDIENLLARRDNLSSSICVLNGWLDDDAGRDDYEAGEAAFQALREEARLDDVDLLLDLASGRLLAGRPNRVLRPAKPVSVKRSYRRRRAIRGVE